MPPYYQVWTCEARPDYRLLLLGVLLLVGPAAGPAAQPDTRTWHFTVLLDERVIGRHDFTVRTTATGLQVESAADLRVTALKIPFYTYVHHDREEWRGGCLSRIEAVTHDNGADSTVSGHAAADGLRVVSNAGTRVLPGCVRSFAYWNRDDILNARQLLNAQNGDYEPVSVRAEGTDTVTAGGQAVTAEHLTLFTPRFRIELWYSSRGEWLALRTHASGGRTVRYEIRA